MSFLSILHTGRACGLAHVSGSDRMCLIACWCETHAFPTPPTCQMCELELCLPVNQMRRSLEVSHSNLSNQLSHNNTRRPCVSLPSPQQQLLIRGCAPLLCMCCWCPLFPRSSGHCFLVVSVLLMYGGWWTIPSRPPYGPCWSRSALQQWGNGN